MQPMIRMAPIVGMVVVVHAVERLRFVAGAVGEHPGFVLPEAADALAELAEDPATLVTACRRLVASRPACGATWWLASRVLCALDPVAAAREAAIELELDPTYDLLAAILPPGEVVVAGSPELAAALGRRVDASTVYLVHDPRRGRRSWRARTRSATVEPVGVEDLDWMVAEGAAAIVEAHALGPDGALVNPGGEALVEAAGLADIPLWLVVAVGRALPRALWEALLARWPGHPEERLALDGLRLAGPGGTSSATEAVLAAGRWPVAAELFRAPRGLV